MQVSRNGIDQAQRTMVVCCLRKISTKRGVTVYENSRSASPFGTLPIMLLPLKEDRQTTKIILDVLDPETEQVNEKGSTVTLDDGRVIHCNVSCKLDMCDGKAVKEASGLGGAYCVLCTVSMADAHLKENAAAGFPMDQSMDDVHAIYAELFDPDIGEVPRNNNDYHERKGLTQEPLTKQNVIHSSRTLHLKLCDKSWGQEFIIRNGARVKKWRGGALKDRQREALEKGRKRLIEMVAEATGIVMDSPTTGEL